MCFCVSVNFCVQNGGYIHIYFPRSEFSGSSIYIYIDPVYIYIYIYTHTYIYTHIYKRDSFGLRNTKECSMTYRQSEGLGLFGL